MPKSVVGKRIRIESTDGVSPELIRQLQIRCVPTEVRFLEDGRVEWVEE
jgi:hypothetical protein